MGMNLDASFDPSVTRFDDANIIAMNRQLATKIGIRVAYIDTTGYKAGTVLALNSTSNLYEPYNDSGSSGINTAVCVLERAIAAGDFPGTTVRSTSALTFGIFGGTVFYDKLTGVDAAAVVDLKGRVIVGADGVNLLKY